MNYFIELYRVEGEEIELIFTLSNQRAKAPQDITHPETKKHAIYFPNSEKIYENITLVNSQVRERYPGYHTDYEQKAISTAVELHDGQIAIRLRVKNVEARKDIVVDFEVIEIGKWYVDHWETIDLKNTLIKQQVIKQMNEKARDLLAFTNRVFNVGLITR